MHVTLNGTSRELSSGTTVSGLLEELGKDIRTVAVELNGDIVPRAQLGEHALREGDRLEIVEFVQGG